MWGRRKRDRSPDEVPTDGSSQRANAGVVTREWIGDVERIGRAAVATLTVRELDGDESLRRLQDLLLSMEATGAVHFVLDVQQVRTIARDCLATLVDTLHRLSSHDGGMAIVNSNHDVDYLFRMTQLDSRFRLCDDVMSALSVIEKPLQPE